MKTGQIMIGDYLQRTYNKEIVKVREVRKNYVYVEGCAYEYEYDELEPIPITPEILKKNGFVIKKKWAQIGNLGDSPLIMWHFEDDKSLYDYKHELEIHENDTGKVHIRIQCDYVHQLQQAMRLCEISKEIEL